MNRLQDVRLLKFKTKGENDMKKMIQKVPIPLCGVMLGFAALGNLLQSYGEGIRYVCGGIATFFTDTCSDEIHNVSGDDKRRF